MPPAVLIRGGGRLYLVRPNGSIEMSADIAPSASVAADRVARGYPEGLPKELADRVRAGAGPLGADPALRGALRTTGSPELSEIRRLREMLPAPARGAERSFLLALARAEVREALRTPEAMLVQLAREETRFARAKSREEDAASSFLTGDAGVLATHAVGWASFRKRFDEQHRSLEETVDRLAREVAPNLSATIGPRVAARLIAASGGLDVLARGPGARLQLLGARRRPAGRGPRHGLLVEATGMKEVPDDRRGAYARTLAALAVVAARADRFTHSDISARLRERRERRIRDLSRRRGP